MANSLPFSPPTFQHVLEVNPCQCIQLSLFLQHWCIIYHSLSNKVFTYRQTFRLLPVFTSCNQPCNEYLCVSFLVHDCKPPGIIFETVQYEMWMLKDTLITRDQHPPANARRASIKPLPKCRMTAPSRGLFLG